MSPEELGKRFGEEIDKRAVDDKYIDFLEELELLQIAIQHGYSPEWAKRNLTQICQEQGFVVESAVAATIRDRLNSLLDPAGCLDRRGYETLVKETGATLQCTTRTDRDVRRLVITTIDDLGTVRVKTGWLTNWYLRAKRQMGLA